MRRVAILAETFVPGDAESRAAMAAAALDSAADPEQVRLLRLALRMMDLRLANVVLTGRPAALSAMSGPARERYLRGWSDSRFGWRRSAFQAWKRLLCFLAYADPGTADHPNPRLAAIGYEPALEPVTPAPTPIVSFVVPVPVGRGPVEIEADVVVIGSGAGGGVVARELARAGRSVVVLEAGPLVTEPSMPTDEMAAFDQLYLDRGLTATWDGAIQILAGSGVGGGTTINWTTCIAPPDDVRAEWARRHGLDWLEGPEYDADLAAVEADLGFAAPPNVPPKDAAILRGAAALGIEAAETRRSAVDCGDCGSCPFGCRRGAKRSTLRVHLAEAWRLGTRIIPNATADRVLIDAGRTVGVEATVRRAAASDPVKLRVRANQVVVAAGALRTPGVLERSGVTHPALGRFLRLHPVSILAARYAEPVRMWRGTMQAARSLAFLGGADGGAAADVPADGARARFVLESAPGHPGLFGVVWPWESAAQHARDMAVAGQIAPFIAICRDADWGRVTPTRAGRTRIDYRLTAGDVQALRAGLVAAARVARASGAEAMAAVGTPALWFGGPDRPGGDDGAFRAYVEALARFDFSPNRGTVFSAHQMGTARMGARPGIHPTDSDGRVRWAVAGIASDRVIAGLYVADASLFPTDVGVNPMVTVMLLARRVARTVLAEGRPG